VEATLQKNVTLILRLDKMLHIFSSLNGTTKNNNPRRIKNEGFFGTAMTVLSDNSSHLIVAPLTTVKTNFVKM